VLYDKIFDKVRLGCRFKMFNVFIHAWNFGYTLCSSFL